MIEPMLWARGGYTFSLLFIQSQNQGSEHNVMMTLLKAIRDIYCVKTHNSNVQLTLVLIKMEQVVTAKGWEIATGVAIKRNQLGGKR